ncbi:DUF4126 domain-containing protein [Intrasporangium calvum]|uniref:DUF4126 domain-containing protein n=1 Tax=Intrasporangium calvum TaxID=53358 RepID=A0ABT5GGN8_9MICO|nr:DUF4126 domain-containing protein [Intrasporangium calvum]MDC5697424.1 DUF4126 domain-containing protein [Intrasporangium calvum]
MIEVLTGMGLSAAAGLNAYVPFLLVALVARFTDLVTLPAGLAWIESGWAIGIGSVLLLTEVVLDKIAVVDTINDTVQTLIRPSMGGLMFAATSAAQEADQSSWMADNPWLGVALGVVVSGLVHAGKATARPAVDAGTLGLGTPVVSTAEDTASVGLSLAALFAPLLVIVGLVLLAGALIKLLLVMRRWRRRRRPRAAPVP